MSTNDPTSSVSQLSTLRQRYHLEHLLETRYDLAIVAVEQLSHGLAAADETYQRLLTVEDEIKTQFPATYADSWTRWVHDDATRLHGTGVLVTDCSICEQIAASNGLNLEGPEAA